MAQGLCNLRYMLNTQVIATGCGDPVAPFADLKPVVHISHRDFVGESPLEFSDSSLMIIRGMLEEALAPFNIVKLARGERIFLKPNFVRPDYRFNPAVSTDPRVILALGELLKDAGAEYIAAGDNPGKGLSFRDILNDIPGSDTWERRGIHPYFYGEAPPVEVELSEAALFRRMLIPSDFQDFSLFINLPKLKMHMHTTASLGIKNLYGLLLDEQRMSFHREDVSRKLVEILTRFPPDLTVIDGIWALEGQAPICGEPVTDFNCIFAGTNPVAVDSVAAKAMGVSPVELTAVRLASRMGLGPSCLKDIEVTGAPLSEVRRYLKRPVVSSTGAYRNCEVFELGACVGCMSSLRHALDRLHYGGRLERQPVSSFVLGVPGPFYQPLSDWEGDLWLIGDCVSAIYPGREEVIRISGCPPHFMEIMLALESRYGE